MGALGTRRGRSTRRVLLSASAALAGVAMKRAVGDATPSEKRSKRGAVVLDERVTALRARLTATRRELHRNAQLSFEESWASAFIEKELRGMGLEVQTGLAQAPEEFKGAGKTYTRGPGTGITATIHGQAGPGPCVALRADMDALPIQEESSLEYCSVVQGAMHACGHDGHVSILLAAAQILVEGRAKLRGSVRLLFQPAEEFGGGAKYMIKDGCLDGVDSVYGLHLLNTLETGTIGVKAGPLMAAPDKFTCQVVGKGGHGAMPHLSVDAMATSSHILSALQTVVSRSVDPLDSAVVTVGKMENEEGSTTCGCGHTFNVICGKVVMHGTSRSFSDSTQALLRRRISEVTSGVASALGAKASTRFDDVNYGYPAVVNAEAEAAIADKAARAVVGAEGVLTGKAIMTMAGEDFSYYLRERPGCFVFVGSREAGTPVKPHHHPSFDIDEEALPIGAAWFVRLVEDQLGA